uniref:Transthyretin/hydroxyisourate hydrolase domain-containing protein n=1 Tax=Moschus moschiferus TaxID=68415 RepID=A0A8C6DY58_MOSMO
TPNPVFVLPEAAPRGLSGLPANPDQEGKQTALVEGPGQWWAPTPLPSCTVLDNRCAGLLPPGQIKTLACKLSFNTKGYWQKRGQESFYPYMCRPVCLRVVFTITDETHKYHGLPLLSPWAYTTYRGS